MLPNRLIFFLLITYVRIILYAFLNPKSTSRKKGLGSSVIKIILIKLGESTQERPVSYESDLHKDRMPKRPIIEKWIKLPTEPLIRGATPCLQADKKTFQDWVWEKTRFSIKPSSKRTFKEQTDTFKDPTQTKRKVHASEQVQKAINLTKAFFWDMKLSEDEFQAFTQGMNDWKPERTDDDYSEDF